MNILDKCGNKQCWTSEFISNSVSARNGWGKKGSPDKCYYFLLRQVWVPLLPGSPPLFLGGEVIRMKSIILGSHWHWLQWTVHFSHFMNGSRKQFQNFQSDFWGQYSSLQTWKTWRSDLPQSHRVAFSVFPVLTIPTTNVIFPLLNNISLLLPLALGIY